jgi:hypothetical protein
MTKYIKKIENILDEDLFIECQNHAKNMLHDSSVPFTTNYFWEEGVRKDSNIVLVHRESSGYIFERIKDTIKNKLNHTIEHIMFYYWMQGSHIPWHNDNGHNGSITIYLNEIWDNDHGGLFLFEHENEIKGTYPKRNMAIEQYGNIRHSVCPTTVTSDIRYTIQIFL